MRKQRAADYSRWNMPGIVLAESRRPCQHGKWDPKKVIPYTKGASKVEARKARKEARGGHSV